ncbi:MAG: hypothetical protein LUG16_08480 [Candidatus Gastranaerophilales bacterium]|nr:hypothetical protein [Candidatus Gastranaerophilales bacterium]
MDIFPVSFGKHIPAAACNIIDKSTNSSIPVTIYELDCDREKDIEDVKNAKGMWIYKNDIVYNMQKKLNFQKFFSSLNTHKFYVMENSKDEIIGMCQIQDLESRIKIDYLESIGSSLSKPEYKYVGQSLLALVGMNSLKKGSNKIIIPIPVENAKKFYTKKCGFKQKSDNTLQMKKQQIKQFVTKIKHKTELKDIS